MLNNIGPSIEPCGTPKTMASQSLTDELMRFFVDLHTHGGQEALGTSL